MNQDQNINPEEALRAVFGEPQQIADGITAFGPVVYSYTRAQAVADGVQVEVTKTAQEAGIRFPVFLTRTVFDAYVAVPPDVTGQDEAGRLWDIVWMLRFAIQRTSRGVARLPFALYVRNDNRAAKLIKLVAVAGPLDIDDPSPAITVMLPDED
ncbi:MAG TPA: hypothetical protein PKO21_04770 [Verrucomicrobiota bacterium]|nr:hypothetical protein [Verrucomicrobiota bacterium]